MSKQPPERIAVDRGTLRSNAVGRTRHGQQCILTTTFTRASSEAEQRIFQALYLFDEDGRLVEARIDELGTCADPDRDKGLKVLKQRCNEIYPISHGRIEIRPFALERFGTTFGLVLHDHGDSGWSAEMVPGNDTVFDERLDSGEYGT